MAKETEARTCAKIAYQKERRRFLNKLDRLKRTRPDVDWEDFFERPKSYLEISKDTSTQNLKRLTKDMELFTYKYGHVLEKENGVVAPRAFHEQYQRSLAYVNRQRRERQKKSVVKELKPLEEPKKATPQTFGEFMRKTIQKASPKYAAELDARYKNNYIQAIKNAYGGGEFTNILIGMVRRMNASDMADAYYKPGNESLSINEIYPGEDMSDEELEEWVKHLINKWKSEFPDVYRAEAENFKKTYLRVIRKDGELKLKYDVYKRLEPETLLDDYLEGNISYIGESVIRGRY